MGFPVQRMRRLRRNEGIRNMVQESRLSVYDLIYPMFVVHGTGIKKEIEPLPGNYHLSVDRLEEEARAIHDLGIPAVILFGLPEKRDEMASEAYDPKGIVQQAIARLKKNVPGLIIIADVCLCEYTPHGHCGIIKDGYLLNDQTVDLLQKVTLAQAEAGCDIVAPAAMMDGQVAAMRSALDKNGFTGVSIMGYSAKMASKLYDPFFKSATESAVAFGDKKSHQMNYANANEALREIAFDIEEGADIVMVKPGMFYMDIIYRAKQKFGMPLAVYSVSGEYAMIKSAAQLGRINEREITMELLTSIKRAGADLILTYAAREIAPFIK
ncbi:MAG TPA: porphobilinogen synthase [Candidatus Aminicenantes bacterium]|nr:porphobilinogen synthase [Candidatus Aminicenantes bacterium]